MKRVYLSGPMSGITDNKFPAFHEWADRLRSDGFDVVSPAEIQEAGTWELCLRADLRELCSCEAIALMPGWENSKGANLELHVAHRLGMEVMHLPPQFDIILHLRRQMEFSERTFGPGERTDGVCDHIRKELNEVISLREQLSFRIGEMPTTIFSFGCLKDPRPEIQIKEVIEMLIDRLGLEIKRTPASSARTVIERKQKMPHSAKWYEQNALHASEGRK